MMSGDTSGWSTLQAAIGLAALLGLIVASLFADSYAWIPLFAAVSVGFSIACWGQNHHEIKAAVLHGVAIIPLVLTGVVLCQVSCGQLTDYEQILGLPTTALGIAGHLLAVLLLSVRKIPRVLATLASCAMMGGSLFFAYVLVRHGSFCPSCFGTHAVMLALLAVTIGNQTWQDWFGRLGWILAFGGLLSVMFHPAGHLPEPADPERVHSRLESVWQGDDSDMVRADESDRPTPNTSPSVSDNQHQAKGDETETAVTSDQSATSDSYEQDSAPEAKTTATAEAPPAFQMDRRLGIIGDPTAPVILVVNMHPECRACAAHWGNLRALESRISDGRVQIRLLLMHDRADARAAIDAMYLSTMMGDDTAIAVISAVMESFQKPDGLAAVDQIIEEHFPSESYGATSASLRKQIDRLLKQTAEVRFLERVSSTPFTWIYRNGDRNARRRFPTATGAATLRLAVDTVLAEVRQEP